MKFAQLCDAYAPLLLRKLSDAPFDAAGELESLGQMAAAGAVRREITPSASSDEEIRGLDRFFFFLGFARCLDPTHEGRNNTRDKYLGWICKSFLENPVRPEDWYKIRADLSYFESLSARLHADGKPNQIEDIAGVDALEKLLRPYARARAEKEQKRMELHMPAEQKTALMAQTTVAYDGPEGKIVLPHTVEAARYWGNNTRWCISAREGEDNRFEGYYQVSPIVIYLPAPSPGDRNMHENYASFRFAVAEGELYDELDDEPLSAPPCLKRLAAAARARWPQEEVRDWLDRHAATREIAALPDAPPRVEPMTEEQEWALEAIVDMDMAGMVTGDIPAHLLSHRAFMLGTAKVVPEVLEHETGGFRQDRDFMLELVSGCGRALLHGHPDFLKDKEMALTALGAEGDERSRVFERLDETLRHDGEVALCMVKQYSESVYHLPPKLRRSMDFMVEVAHATFFNRFVIERMTPKIQGEFEKFSFNNIMVAAQEGAKNVPSVARRVFKMGFGLSPAFLQAYNFSNIQGQMAEKYTTDDFRQRLQEDIQSEKKRSDKLFYTNLAYASAAISAAIRNGTPHRAAKDLHRVPALRGDFHAVTSPRRALEVMKATRRPPRPVKKAAR